MWMQSCMGIHTVQLRKSEKCWSAVLQELGINAQTTEQTTVLVQAEWGGVAHREDRPFTGLPERTKPSLSRGGEVGV